MPRNREAASRALVGEEKSLTTLPGKSEEIILARRRSHTDGSWLRRPWESTDFITVTASAAR